MTSRPPGKYSGAAMAPQCAPGQFFLHRMPLLLTEHTTATAADGSPQDHLAGDDVIAPGQ